MFGYDPHTDTVMIKEQGTHGGVVNLRLYKAEQLQVRSRSSSSCSCSAALQYLEFPPLRQNCRIAGDVHTKHSSA